MRYKEYTGFVNWRTNSLQSYGNSCYLLQVLCLFTARIPHPNSVEECTKLKCALVDLIMILNPYMMESKTLSLGLSLDSSSFFFFLLLPISVVVCQQWACHLGEVYGRLKGSLLLCLSP